MAGAGEEGDPGFDPPWLTRDATASPALCHGHRLRNHRDLPECYTQPRVRTRPLPDATCLPGARDALVASPLAVLTRRRRRPRVSRDLST